MPNPHSKGQLAHFHPSSIIEKNGLGNFVLELYNQGKSYSEISLALWERHSVKCSKMAIQRFINRNDKRFTPSRVGTSLEIIRESTIQKTADYYDTFGRIFEEINLLVDSSKLSSLEKLAIRKSLDAKRKLILQQYNENRAELGLLMEAVIKHEEGINEVLLDFSRQLCPDCRKKVVDIITDYEKKR